jgi:hypothetical protein
MIPEIRELTTARPFVPFTVHTVDGGALHVPTLDHVHVTPAPERVFIWRDDGKYDKIRPLMISRITVDEQANGSSAA